MPNWYGIEGISFEWKGEQNDPPYCTTRVTPLMNLTS